MDTQSTFARIYSETSSHIDRHLGRVKEGRDVDAACSFARWFFWSGIPELLKFHSTPLDTPSPLKCDGAHLMWKLNELLQACNEFYRTGKPAGLDKTDLDSIRDKLDKLASNLDLVAGHVSKLSPSSPGYDLLTPVAEMVHAPLSPGGAGGRWGVDLPCQSVITRTGK